MKTIGFLPLFKQEALYERKFLGRPLFCWALGEAIFSDLEKIIVATGNKRIKDFIAKNYQWNDKIEVVANKSGSSTKEAFANLQKENPGTDDIFCLLNPLSPFVTSDIINNCLNNIKNDDFDAALTVVELVSKMWDNDGNNLFFKKEKSVMMENTAVFCTLNTNDFSEEPETAMVTMPIETLCQMSTKNWESNEKIMADRLISEKGTVAIKHLVLDVDGVFTDGGVYYDAKGELSKRFDIRDGMGLEILREQGVQVVVMTSEDSAVVKKRMEKLKIEHVFLHAKDKFSLLEKFITDQKITRGSVAYIGDDVNDLANLCSVGWSFCPQNATNAVKPYVDIILSKDAGNGAIREATERILIYNKRFSK